MRRLLFLLFVSLIFRETQSTCPCANPSLCDLITTPARQEAFIFRVDTNQDFKLYDWTIVTTIAEFTTPSTELLCYAHENGVRLVGHVTNFDVSQLNNATLRAAWVKSNVQMASDNFYDGLNVDIESPVSSADAPLLTQLIAELRDALDTARPGSQLSVDVAWNTGCVDERCYDYSGLSKAADFLFVMDYDMQSQIFAPRPCLAYANSPLPWNEKSIDDYMALGIEPSKLVMGIPWYGYQYECLAGANSTYCPIKQVAFRGAYCSDAAGSQLDYGDIMNRIAAFNGSVTPEWDSAASAPFFNYIETSVDGSDPVQWTVRYDDPRSIGMKCDLFKQKGLRGVGMWNADALDYSDSPRAQQQTEAMWKALHRCFS